MYGNRKQKSYRCPALSFICMFGGEYKQTRKESDKFNFKLKASLNWDKTVT